MLLIRDRDVAQLVACCFWIAEVESSSLSIPTLLYLRSDICISSTQVDSTV